MWGRRRPNVFGNNECLGNLPSRKDSVLDLEIQVLKRSVDEVAGTSSSNEVWCVQPFAT